jgi:hypothetical protein
MMIGYDIYDCFTMEHFRLRQRMTLTTKIYCSRLYEIPWPRLYSFLFSFNKKSFVTNLGTFQIDARHHQGNRLLQQQLQGPRLFVQLRREAPGPSQGQRAQSESADQQSKCHLRGQHG